MDIAETVRAVAGAGASHEIREMDARQKAAARTAVETAATSVRELRVAEVVRQDLTIQEGGVVNYRIRLGISFKYNPGE